jgi:hypothetical protein
MDRAMPLPDETGAGLDLGCCEELVTAIPLDRQEEPDEAPPQGRGEPAQRVLLQAVREPADHEIAVPTSGRRHAVRFRPAAAELLDAQALESPDLLGERIRHGGQRAVSRLGRDDRRAGTRRASPHGWCLEKTTRSVRVLRTAVRARHGDALPRAGW